MYPSLVRKPCSCSVVVCGGISDGAQFSNVCHQHAVNVLYYVPSIDVFSVFATTMSDSRQLMLYPIAVDA